MKSLFLIFLFFPFVCDAKVRVAFFKMYSNDGKLVRLEPDGQFFHVAIQLADGRWAHTHPVRGSETVTHLSKIGSPSVILINESWPDIHFEDISSEIDKPFDFTYTWDDPHTSYCAKFVGIPLACPPLPMLFAAEFWKNRPVSVAQSPRLGLSPDDVFRFLQTKGFMEEMNCPSLLISPFMQGLHEAK